MDKEVSKKPENNLNKNGDKRGMHPNSRKNLIPNGNPNGRPRKDKSITSLIRQMLDEKADYIAPGATPSDKTWRQLIAKAILYHAAKGNPTMIKELLDRLEGKVVQPIGGEDGGAIEVRIDYKRKILSAVSRHVAGGGEREDISGA